MEQQLDYPLTEKSVVVEVGGWRGEWAAKIVELYDSHVMIFEPIKEYYQACVSRFAGNDKVIIVNKGLGIVNGLGIISKTEQASSLFLDADVTEQVELADAVEALHYDVDLLALNCEGSEYLLLSYLIESGAILRCANVLIQFHKFMSNAEGRRDMLRHQLSKTHTESWCVPFGWESWRRK